MYCSVAQLAMQVTKYARNLYFVTNKLINISK